MNDTITLYFIRHGKTGETRSVNKDGYPDPALSDVGRQQAILTGKAIAAMPCDALYASDLTRTRETADLIGTRICKAIHLDSRLREIHMGRFHTATEAQVQQEYPEFYKEFQAKTSDFRYPPDGESGDDVRQRVEDFLAGLYGGNLSHVGIVTHGGVIRSILSHYLGLPQYKRFQIKPYNCGISRIVYHRNARRSDVITINEIGHLGENDTF